MKLLQQSGLQLAWISGGRGESIARRAQDLGIAHCFAEVKDKSAVLKALQQKHWGTQQLRPPLLGMTSTIWLSGRMSGC